ncbi:MAG: hypothetical protein IKM39_03840 [Clostridia bacterium]|nr:hypothetical protein [Clostridia bacterium]
MHRMLSLLFTMMLILSTIVVPMVSADVSLGEMAGYYGDVDDNYTINARDALMVLMVTVNKQKFTDQQFLLADVDGSKTIDAKDALQMLRYSVGLIDMFSVGEVADTYTVSQEGYVDPDTAYVAYEKSDFAYDTSLSVNGAYAEDTTADNSFVMDMTGLQPNTIYSITLQMKEDFDVARLVYSLQGLINRDFGRDAQHSSIVYFTNDSNDTKWMQYMQEEGSVYAGMEKVRITSWEAFFETFKNQIAYCGMILWDGNVPATANVAATICGLDGYLPVLANSPFHAQLKEAGISEKQSLVGLFENGKRGQKIQGTNVVSTGSAKNDAYRWAMDKYFDRCSSNYLAYILDGAPTIRGYEAYEDHPSALVKDYKSNCLSNHDYLIARRCFFFDLYPYTDDVCDDTAQQLFCEVPCPHCSVKDHYTWDELMDYTDPVCANCGEKVSGFEWEDVKEISQAPMGTDNETMLMIFDRRYQRANGAIGQLMGFPPWWIKYTTHSDQGSKEGTWIEWLYCEYITCYNLAKEADAAHPCSMANGSAYYKYVPLQESYSNNFEEYYKASGLEYDEDTFYYTLYIGDYDSSAWLKQRVCEFWMLPDRARGKLPLTWCFNPNLSNRVPMVFDYIYANKFDNEFIAAGDSGAGYIIPSGLFGGSNLAYTQTARPETYENGDVQWANYCKKFYERFDIKATGFIINGSNAYTTDILGMYSTFSTMGGLHNGGGALMTNYKGVPYIYCQNGIDTKTDMAKLYDHATTRMNGYNFGAYRTICLSPSELLRIVNNFDEYAAQKGLKTQYVELYSLLALAKESGQGFKVN